MLVFHGDESSSADRLMPLSERNPHRRCSRTYFSVPTFSESFAFKLAAAADGDPQYTYDDKRIREFMSEFKMSCDVVTTLSVIFTDFFNVPPSFVLPRGDNPYEKERFVEFRRKNPAYICKNPRT